MKNKIYFLPIKEDKLDNYLPHIKKGFNEIANLFPFNKNEVIPIKITIGDSTCTHNIKPEVIKIIIDILRKKETKPFLFDTSVIYKGRRQNAIDHLSLAQTKGFSLARLSIPYIIADGLFGLDGKEYKIDSEYLDKIKIPSFIGLLDNLIVVSHITGHILTSYAGAIKNIAMGMSCKPTKQVIHSSEKQKIIEERCTYCGCCLEVCPANAIILQQEQQIALIQKELCTGCGECLCVCKYAAIQPIWKENHLIFIKRLVDVAHFILSKFKKKIFINFLIDITENCDCVSDYREKKLCHNIGILIGEDVLSIEKASIDLISQQGFKYDDENSKLNIETLLYYGKEKGIGVLDYEIIKIL